MFELLIIVLFVWLMFKTAGLAFKLTWGIAKIAASILMALAFPVMIFCLVFAGGIVLLFPIALVCIAAGILKASAS